MQIYFYLPQFTQGVFILTWVSAFTCTVSKFAYVSNLTYVSKCVHVNGALVYLMCSNINKYVRIVLCKHFVSADVKDDVTKKQIRWCFVLKKCLKWYFGPRLYLDRNTSVFKSLNKMMLSYKYFHWFGFGGCTLNRIWRFKQNSRYQRFL